ncbi:hypothetical protein RAS12_30910 (plasmid) [Achromobacter seleniivolatilans]|uniref:Uncharacterized protein n=1 Tax=Achromobacter seleniivolatilans TaxID=3047478 RepID=A0ABY9MBE0_9BURK|nr:hypothetical protein [Achromobacter sp. R39]WMD24045.1 hypothetical protein RAS12_30910 [Achromobacter sp. R39]
MSHDNAKECSSTTELFGSLITARCSCRSESCEQKCSESSWLQVTKSFVKSYVPALVEARNAAPLSSAWWSSTSERAPVPTLSEYFELMEGAPGVSPAARAQMAHYLERSLPGYDKTRGRDQNAVCSQQLQYRANIAIHYFSLKAVG